METKDLIFIIIVFFTIAIGIIWIATLMFIQSRQFNKKGWSKCSVCAKAESTMYYYHRRGVKYYHCREHFDYDHRKLKLK